ncbi:TetR/AcrR family transcriptional regulator [Parvibaculum sp.]|uniref:TetR/AcrR family transcriptional regulator n=1 Tax=Parvibaculum sp. TaxID=2024848 RepID=UPI001B05A199|nr:TetR/AcrR family transcriptional regulator [Parvibaculum sp.]MBO6634726.1 TetR family transcriptional regulator [Parvibaculum sp.]MBO6677766.1 TetR family transcriptional regulator [Parvibaculum sp.]MBO6684763.1 TetR family transcriptional regulator [Parvibaculum sp.]MBO6904800.1 TetR family transcriptional regulator [Parvibaculum sp.]
MAKAAIASPWKSETERKTERALKREAVLAAAAHVFSERGYHRASLDEVAQVLNITKPTLYYYFKNKEAMLFACVQHGLDMLEAAGGAEDGNGRAQLAAYLEGYAAVIETDFGRCAVRISDAELSEASRKKVRRIKGEIDRKIRQLVTAGIADGSIASSDPKITAFALAGALNSIGQWHPQAGVPADKKLAGEYINLLMNGLAPR